MKTLATFVNMRSLRDHLHDIEQEERRAWRLQLRRHQSRLIVSNPYFPSTVLKTPVTTAPTILRALGIDPGS